MRVTRHVQLCDIRATEQALYGLFRAPALFDRKRALFTALSHGLVPPGSNFSVLLRWGLQQRDVHSLPRENLPHLFSLLKDAAASERLPRQLYHFAQDQILHEAESQIRSMWYWGPDDFFSDYSINRGALTALVDRLSIFPKRCSLSACTGSAGLLQDALGFVAAQMAPVYDSGDANAAENLLHDAHNEIMSIKARQQKSFCCVQIHDPL